MPRRAMGRRSDHSSAIPCQRRTNPMKRPCSPCASLLLVSAELRRFRSRLRLRAGVQVRARNSDVNNEAVIVIASARKKLPVTSVTEMSGRNTTTGEIGEKTGEKGFQRKQTH